MASEASENSELAHGSVSECSVLEDSFDLLDGNSIANILVAASFYNH